MSRVWIDASTRYASKVSRASPTRAGDDAPITHNAPRFSRDAALERHHRDYESLREMLRGKGWFVSQTDTEVIAHLIRSMYGGDLFQPFAKPSSNCSAYAM